MHAGLRAKWGDSNGTAHKGSMAVQPSQKFLVWTIKKLRPINFNQLELTII